MNKFKTLLLIAAIGLAAVPAHAQAANLTAQWDYPADQLVHVEEFRVYEITGTTTPKVATSAKGTAASAAQTAQILNVAPGVHNYYVTAWNSFWGESARSNTASTPPAATAPGQMRVKVTVTTIGRAGIKSERIEYYALEDLSLTTGKGKSRK